MKLRLKPTSNTGASMCSEASLGAMLAAVLLLGPTASPSFAQHRARLSADLAGHLTAGSPSIDVIVHGDQGTVDAIAGRYNLRVARRMKSGAVLRVNAGQLDALHGDPDVDHLSGDLPIRASMAITNVTIGADQVWAGTPGRPALNGKHITVAVIDSGIDDRHVALRNRVLAKVDFTGGNGADQFGHGTHVAGIIAGQAGRTPEAAGVQGVAPGAQLINLRVLGEDGSGKVSSVIEAVDWAIEHRKQYDIAVINLSLGAPVLQPYRDDPLCEAVERAVAAGIVVVASAGNLGRTSDGRMVFGGITSPGNDPYVLTVGALDTHGTTDRSDDTVAPYSSRGPTRYDLVIKPDLVAPGSHIVSAEAAGSYLSKTFPQRHVTGTGDGSYLQLSGTSMAAGVVSGTVALVLQADRRLKPLEVRALVQMTSEFSPAAGLLTGGAGSVNALSVTDRALTKAGRCSSVTTTVRRVDANVVTATPSVQSRSDAASTCQPSRAGLNGLETSMYSYDPRFWNDPIVWGDSIIWSNATSIIWSNGDT